MTTNPSTTDSAGRRNEPFGATAEHDGRKLTGRRRIVKGVTAIGVAGAVLLGVNGFAAAGVGHTNNPGTTAGSLQSSGTGLLSSASAGAKSLQYYSIAASGFSPDGIHDATEDYFNGWDPTTLSNQDTGRCFNASIHLPNGVKMVSATFYYTAGSVAMYGELNEQTLVSHSVTTVVDFDSVINPVPTYTSTVEEIAKADQVVNTQNAYSLGVCASGTTTFSGVTIAYTG
jgi:hypothetical protein